MRFCALLLVLVLVACGGSPAEEFSPDDDDTADDDTADDDTADDDTADDDTADDDTADDDAADDDTADDDSADDGVPELGAEGARTFTVLATDDDGLDVPRDLAFHPDRPDELWTVNQAIDGTVILFDPGETEQEVEVRVDAWSYHFMEEVSSMAFGANDTFATCQESRNTYDNTAPPNDFMGPALWPADLDIYAEVHQDDLLQGSHLDMLHESPLCMGIAHDHDNVFWVFDGLNEHIVRYDFQVDHGPGHDEHSDGIVRRYVDAEVTRVAGVPSHLVLDQDSGWLYVADTGGARILRLDTESGEVSGALRETLEPLAEYSKVEDATVETFVEDGLEEPSGIALHDGRLFVSDHATGEIVAYDLADGRELARVETGASGIMGLEVGPDGRLYYVDGDEDTVTRIDVE